MTDPGQAVLGDAAGRLGTAGGEGTLTSRDRMFGKHRGAPTSGHGTVPHVAECQRYCDSASGSELVGRQKTLSLLGSLDKTLSTAVLADGYRRWRLIEID